jgi:cell division protein FtsQ
MPRVKEPARPSRLKLLLRRQRHLLRPALLAAAGFGVVLAGIVLLRSAAPGGVVFALQRELARALDLRVRQVEIEGRGNTPEPLLRAALGVSPGDPILGFSVEGARQRIESLSWVRHAAIERRLPGTIHVALTERRPVAIWQNQGKFVLIDRQGQVVTDEDAASFADLPLVVGADAPAHAAALLDALGAVPAIKDHVAAAVRVGGRRWNLQMKNRATVMLPEDQDAAALRRLAELQSSAALLDRPLQAIDLRLPDRLVVRPMPASAPAATGAAPLGHPVRRAT